MAKTRIYLDVDGVLNAIPAHHRITELTEWTEFVSVVVLGYKITYAPELLRALEALPSEDTEIVWLTTWRERAVTDLSPAIEFNATLHRVVSDGDLPTGYKKYGADEWGWGYWWKASAMAEDLTLNPVDFVVWLDDDSVNFTKAVTDVSQAFPDITFLVIAPQTELGLTRQHIQQVKGLVNSVDTSPQGVVS